MEWLLPAAEVFAALLVAVIVLPLVWLFFRRRWLARRGGTFDCCLRVFDASRDEEEPLTGWVLGVARYSGERLEWFRTFSLSFRPRKVFDRNTVHAVEHRDPAPDELGLLAGQEVVVLERVDKRAWELAMAPDSLTGLLSWLEASPPSEPTL
ncbi:MAG: DUF2550 domain-containing protein [Propionibacteriaceae bacterium]|jgi:hypothetical protein|nr:DUF2550 domain-containing protein [Propionibacteriaceae bacterium]